MKFKVALILTLSAFFSFKVSAAENVFTIDKPLRKIVTETIQRFENEKVTSGVTLRNLDIPEEIFDVDTKVSFEGFPKQKYYKVKITLLSPVNKLNFLEKTLEVWGKDDKTICRSTIEVGYGKDHHFPLRWVDRIKDRIISRIEEEVLQFEESKIKEL